jgi:hypothetical protein
LASILPAVGGSSRCLRLRAITALAGYCPSHLSDQGCCFVRSSHVATYAPLSVHVSVQTANRSGARPSHGGLFLFRRSGEMRWCYEGGEVFGGSIDRALIWSYLTSVRVFFLPSHSQYFADQPWGSSSLRPGHLHPNKQSKRMHALDDMRPHIHEFRVAHYHGATDYLFVTCVALRYLFVDRFQISKRLMRWPGVKVASVIGALRLSH